MNTFSRFARSAPARRTALAAWLLAEAAGPAAAGGDPVPPHSFLERGHQAEAKAEETEDKGGEKSGGDNVRLIQFNANWPDVLESVAEQSNSTLIMQDVPPGRFTSAERRKMSRHEAVEILNRKLTVEGFRILENGDYLIVMHERTMRKQYRPTVLPPEDEFGRPLKPAALPEPLAESHGYRRQFDTVRPATAEQPAGGRPRTITADAAEPSRLPAERTGPLRRPSAPEAAAEPQPIVQVAGEATVTVPVRVGRGHAVSIARQVHEAFGRSSELLDAGPSGLPAFRLSGSPIGGTLQVEIDSARDELIITGPKESATAVAGLLRDLDVAPDPTRTPRVVPANAAQLKLAGQLGPLLAQLGNAGQNANPPAAGNVPPNATPVVPQPGRQPMPPGQNPAAEGEIPALIGNLQGDVTVEAVPQLGVLVIRGNQADVDQVLQVIRTLEQLSAGQTPAVELLRLQHVDSIPLAELLTTVYGRLATIRNRGAEAPSQVAVLPVGNPNAVIVVAPEAEIESILDLATQLDQPTDPTAEFQVFRLRHAAATQAATLIEQFYAERPALGTRVKVTSDLRTNSLIVSGRPRDLAEVAELVRRIDRGDSAVVSRMRVFPLQSASAEEIAGVITSAIASVTGPQQAAGGGGAAPAELQVARSAVLEYLDATGAAPQLIRSGLLADVRVTPDPRTNSLLVSADEQSLPLIEALIERLDRPSAAVAELKVFTLENSDATAVVDLLQSLFGTTAAGGNAAAQGVQLAGASDAGSSLVPLRFATDVRTNSVIASGGPEALRVVEAVLLRLDESDVRQRETTVIKLKNAYAPDVAIAINQFLTSQRDLSTINPDLVSNIELLERELIVVPDAQSNSLLVSSTPRYFDEIIRIIEKLDQAPPQVIIQAMLVEVNLDNTDELGIELGFQDSTLFDRSLSAASDLTTLTTTNTSPNGVATSTQNLISRAASPGFLFNSTNPLGNNVTTRPQEVGAQGLSNFALGRANADLGYGGFVFSASSANVNVLLRALSAKRTIQILSRPQIRALDNQVAQIQVGQVVPVVNGVTITSVGGAYPQIIRDNAGLILTIVPRISPDGTVVMEVAAERSAYTGSGVDIFTDATTGNTITAPIKDITTARSTVAVPTGQTIVMGGIITRSDDTIERKLPYIGDIPYLGQLFRYDSTRTQRRELLIFLTPRVIYSDADSELIKQVEADRLHFIEHEAEMIHGPLYAVPPAGPSGPYGPEGPFLPPGDVPPVFGPSGPMPVEGLPLPGAPGDGLAPGIYPPGSSFSPVGPQGNLVTPSGGPPIAAKGPTGRVTQAVATGRLAGTTELAGAVEEPKPPKRFSFGR